MHVACDTGDVQRLATAVALDQGNQFHGAAVLVFQTTRLQAALKAQRDFGLHVS